MPFAEIYLNIIIMHTVGPDASPKHIYNHSSIINLVNNVLKL